MIKANLQCEFHIIAFWFLLITHVYLIRSCEPPWTQSNCKPHWIEHSGLPQDLKTASEISLNGVSKLVEDNLFTIGSPGFGCLNNESCWTYGWELLSYTGPWTLNGVTEVYACCVIFPFFVELPYIILYPSDACTELHL
ncbi:unnamed protein product [Fasciola hepatica]|uniref:Uncharacterized protein n=1 Tax=Fasciola hepatica TaxID=6192 RepID=A0ABC9HIB8_FASHE|nr:unnamed protein product [Fasciola hepatica]